VCRVLLVGTFPQAVTRLLQREEIITARGAREANYRVRTFIPQVIVIESDLPDGSGLELLNSWVDEGIVGEDVSKVIVAKDREMSVQTDKVMRLPADNIGLLGGVLERANGSDGVTTAQILRRLSTVAEHAKRTKEVLEQGLAENIET